MGNKPMRRFEPEQPEFGHALRLVGVVLVMVLITYEAGATMARGESLGELIGHLVSVLVLLSGDLR
jgi:hypothetical protein